MNEDALPSYETYLEIQKGIGTVLSEYPNSHAYFDYYRAVKAREGYNKWLKGKPLTKEEIKSYFNLSLNPTRGQELTKEEYDRLLQIYGASTIKIAMIDENVKRWLKTSSESEKILSIGGACALESIDTKRIIELSAQDKNLVKKYIEEMFQRFPTWTQITGALIPARVSIFYDETFPWHLKISEYGVSNSELKTQRVYDRTFFTLQRFAKLHNPQNIVLRLPFITLNLDDEGRLEEWAKQYKKYTKAIEDELNLSHEFFDTNLNYKAWIQYTFMGPKILEIALEKLKKEYPRVYKMNNLDSYSIHVRGKQLDHFDIERLNLWMHDILLSNNGMTSQIKKILKNPLMREVSAMFMWARDNMSHINTIGSAGFLDFNYKGKLVHEDRLFTFKEIQKENMKTVFEKLTDSPIRLHSRNLPEVLELLARFKNPHSVSFSKDIILELSNLNSKLKLKERKVETIKLFISYSEFIINLLEQLLSNKSISVLKSSAEIKKMLEFLINRYGSDIDLIRLIKKEGASKSEKIFQLKLKLKKLIRIIQQDSTKLKLTLNDTDLGMGFYAQLKHNLERDKRIYKEYTHEVKIFSTKIKMITETISKNIVKYESDFLTAHVNILPLADNLVASYMQQLLFIPSIQNAYLDMIAVENSKEFSKEDKEQKIVEIINKIYYVIEACLLYIFKNTAYPWEARFESRYERLY